MKPIISIIVPIYNVEKYLDRCITSILNQSYENFELILINDGSTDKSGEICNKYKSKDNRIKVIHKKNEGVAIARNLGIDIALGEYIGFVDSDDYIEKDMYSILYELITKYSADMSACGHTTVTESGVKKQCSDKFICCEKVQALKLFYNMDMIRWSCWDKLFKREAIASLRLEQYAYGEDTLFLLNFINKNNKFVAVENPKYNYFKMNSSSATSAEFSEKKLDLLIYLKRLSDVLYENNILDLGQMAEAQYYERVLSYASKCKKYKINNYKKHYKNLYNIIKKNIRVILKNNRINKIYKIAFILFLIMPNIIIPINIFFLENNKK